MVRSSFSSGTTTLTRGWAAGRRAGLAAASVSTPQAYRFVRICTPTPSFGLGAPRPRSPAYFPVMRAFVLARWPMLVAAAATLAYAGCVLGFGLVFRPLHNDEGVTLDVASANSVRGVLDIAINYRHGPPLHYLLVHFSLLWREDVLGLRLPSALLGILSIPLAYGFGRELLGRAGGAVVAGGGAGAAPVGHPGPVSPRGHGPAGGPLGPHGGALRLLG